MAQKTYSIPLTDPPRVVEAMCAVFQHLVAWKAIYGIDFVSAVRNGPTLDVTFSDPLPQAEITAIKLSLS